MKGNIIKIMAKYGIMSSNPEVNKEIDRQMEKDLNKMSNDLKDYNKQHNITAKSAIEDLRQAIIKEMASCQIIQCLLKVLNKIAVRIYK